MDATPTRKRTSFEQQPRQHAEPERGQTGRVPFGTINAWMGTTHFLTRRLRNVKTEIALNVLAYNIRRMVALIGIQGLMAAMKA